MTDICDPAPGAIPPQRQTATKTRPMYEIHLGELQALPTQQRAAPVAAGSLASSTVGSCSDVVAVTTLTVTEEPASIRRPQWA